MPLAILPHHARPAIAFNKERSMTRYVTTVLILFVFALGAWAQNSPPHQHATAAADVIDGSLHPELIPDSVAFRLYFIALSEKDPTLTEASERQKAFFSTAGLNDADAHVAAAILRTFKQRLDAITDTYNKAVVVTNDSTSDRALFVSKRESLVQATRNAFNVTLSANGASHLNNHVQREKGKIKASKSEIQQIAALRSKPTGFQLVSMKSPQSGCYGYMDLHYNTYTSYATNSEGKNIYVSTEDDGYTGEGNGSWCYGSITHQPQLQLQVGTAGGWFYGQSVIPSSQIYFSETVELLCDVCQQPNSFTVQDDIYCTSLGGFIFSDIIPPGTLRIAVSNYSYVSTAGSVCTYKLYCPSSYASCGYATIGVATPCPSNYFVAYYLVYRTDVYSTCFPVSIGRFSSTPVPCS